MSIVVDKSGPFTHGSNNVQRTMFTVLAALVPATLFNLWLFGWPAIFLFLVTMAACLGCEALCTRIAGGSVDDMLSDGSVMITGWLLPSNGRWPVSMW